MAYSARVCVLAAALCVLAVAHASLPFVHVDPANNRFVDETGRTAIFHGVNVVYKVPPYYPSLDTFDYNNSLTDTDMDNLAAWGFNVVRLGVMWPGVETSRGVYSDAYIGAIRRIIDGLEARGIYTIVDNHQDVLHPRFCGEGVPDYAVHPTSGAGSFPLPNTAKLAKDSAGIPNINDCLKHNFGLFYVSLEASSAFQAIYDNVDGLADAMANYWRVLAKAFVGRGAVLGFELWNEPWVGNYFKDPLLLADPGHADKKNLQPLYEKLHSAIREIDMQHIVFYEPVQTDAVFHAGFTENIGGAAFANRSSYAYHIYCPAVDANGVPTSTLVCHAFDSEKIKSSVADAKRLGVAGFMTEFGAVDGSVGAVNEINYILGLCDGSLQSWTYWQFKYFHDVTTASAAEPFYSANGTLEAAKVKALARPYAPYVQGVAHSMAFDPVKRTFALSFTLDTAINASTEVFFGRAPELPRGLQRRPLAERQRHVGARDERPLPPRPRHFARVQRRRCFRDRLAQELRRRCSLRYLLILFGSSSLRGCLHEELVGGVLLFSLYLYCSCKMVRFFTCVRFACRHRGRLESFARGSALKRVAILVKK
eukprot:Opistho-1_new@62129